MDGAEPPPLFSKLIRNLSVNLFASTTKKLKWGVPISHGASRSIAKPRGQGLWHFVACAQGGRACRAGYNERGTLSKALIGNWGAQRD
jgi:hypothetical protein